MSTVTQPMPPKTANPIRDEIERQKMLIHAGDYVMLGQVDIIHTVEHGSMDFHKYGPMLATLPDRGELLLVSEIPPLPPARKLLDAPCAQCADVCPQCAGKKTALCQTCGGQGWLAGADNCSCVADGKRAPADCASCGGSGRVAVQCTCHQCHGTRALACGLCFGTGQRGRGCDACQGQGRKIELVPQRLAAFVRGTLEGRAAIGPVRAIVFHAVDGSNRIDIVDFRPDRDKQLAALVLEFEQGDASGAAKGFLVGGYPVIRRRPGRD